MKCRLAAKQREDDDVRQQDHGEVAARQRHQRQRQKNGRRDQAGTDRQGRDGLFRRPVLAVLAGLLGTAEQPPGADDQDDRHDHEHEHERALRQEPNAVDIQDRDQERGNERSGNGPHAADDDDHEDGGKDVEVHQQVRASFGELDGAADAREQRPQKEHAGEQPGLIDAERTDHFAVFGRRPLRECPSGCD